MLKVGKWRLISYFTKSVDMTITALYQYNEQGIHSSPIQLKNKQTQRNIGQVF